MRRALTWVAVTLLMLALALGLIWLFKAIGVPALLAVVAAILIVGYVDRRGWPPWRRA